MRVTDRILKVLGLLGIFGLASFFAVRHGTGGLWRGLEIAHAVTAPEQSRSPYDLTRLQAVNATLTAIRDKYVDPQRIRPRQMFLSALDEVQKDVAQVIVLHEEKSPRVQVRIETETRDFRVDNIQGIWDVPARLREVFAFLQDHLKKDQELDLREVEYAACNGMLRTLDPHSVFLSPEAYRDMNLSTSGHFGGLGIVISLRDQQLTVMKPMPDTPAGRAGLKRFDRITKINNESTLNMPLDDAVARLRGQAGSRVTVWVHRDGTEGWTGSRPFELVREEIRIRSVDSRLLRENIGYLRIRQFQATTADELNQALTSLAQESPVAGLVLDLRGNPGGLLEQAARVADAFVSEGVLVSTVGGHEGREEKRATRKGNEPKYPIVVLVNGASASASEIVAGSLKQLGRVVVVGQPTFGKGTVQIVDPKLTPEGAALKLTIAKYLTAGDISIQGTGVIPHILLDPMTVDPLEIDLFRNEGLMREQDLSKSLEGIGQRANEKPITTLRYRITPEQRQHLRELEGDVDDELISVDTPIEFARALARALGAPSTPLSAVQPFLDKAQSAELLAISSDLRKLGIDFSPPPTDTTSTLRDTEFITTVRTDHPERSALAGEPLGLEVTVENRGSVPVYQLRATTKSDNPYLDEKELVFGRVDPKARVVARVPLGWCETEGDRTPSIKPRATNEKKVCKIPLDAVSREDMVTVKFAAERSAAPKDASLKIAVQSLPRPIFSYAYQLVDNRPGNGDGKLQRGEGATLYLTVKNTGTGRSYETQANLRNLTGDGLLLHAGRFDISSMEPGSERHVAFTFDVLDSLRNEDARVELSVVDRDLRVISNEKIPLPITSTPLTISPLSGLATLAEATRVHAGPDPMSAVIGQIEAGSTVEQLGRLGDFTKVRLEEKRFAWVPTPLLGPSSAPTASPRFVPVLRRSPPLIEVEPTALSTREPRITLRGRATDADRVADAFIFVGNRKVFYQANPVSSANTRSLPFEATAELMPGVNVITIVARENADTASRVTLVVRRDGPNGEPLPTKKSELFGEDWEFGSEP